MPQLTEVLEFLDNTGTIMVKRVPDDGPTEIKWGAQLTVRDSQEAIFFRDGEVVDVFGPGRYMLETRNFPVITKWVTSFAYGPDSPFRAEVYFVNKKLFLNLKWGTQEPILFADKDLKMVRLRAYGNYAIKIVDSHVFVNQVVGTMGLYQDATIADYLRTLITGKLAGVIARQAQSVMELPAAYDSISENAKAALAPDFQHLGLALDELNIAAISVPEEVQQMIDQRSGMSALGNLDEFMKYKMAMSIQDAAANPNGAAGQTVGSGVGLGMGLMMPQIVQQTLASAVQSPAPAASSVEKLKELKGLLDLQIITQAEFDQKKSQLLSQL
ncbi:membrane protease subunit (stomatin/prohibitin family) [Mucilaginibacter yixingensis]|uniref:Membrane protease subunit (Stomatin/prohibitin family) n=1 Tax=Mucilaginibacter yixingensis TaxID=1295612 RepID=A0A2T5J7V5_9SPHI|nr:SPFH domain-containing protein [Mucilaginibacter yixingensis]PTQ95502.1 membrane protease subunit (stomatin/prohibitin family) [Mucilaginibacter yixingensis]